MVGVAGARAQWMGGTRAREKQSRERERESRHIRHAISSRAHGLVSRGSSAARHERVPLSGALTVRALIIYIVTASACVYIYFGGAGGWLFFYFSLSRLRRMGQNRCGEDIEVVVVCPEDIDTE